MAEELKSVRIRARFNRARIPVLLWSVLTLAFTGSALARPAPIIPIDAVPENMPADIRKLVLRLYGPDDSDCMQAVQALRAMGPTAAPAAPFLAAILHDEVRHGATAWQAVDALIAIGKPSVEPVLIMFQFGGAYARMRGLKVLSALKDERGIPALVTMIAGSLGASGHSAFDVLGGYGEPAMRYLIDGLKSDNPLTRRNSAYALPAFPTTNTVERLKAAMSDADPEVRAAAREAILVVTLRNPQLAIPAGDAIVRALADPDPAARRAAIRILMRSTDDRKAERLTAMAHDADAGVLQEVIRNINGFTNATVEATLIGLVSVPDPEVGNAALNALASRGSTNVIPVLAELLNSSDPTVREGAVARLGAYHSPHTMGILLSAVRDPDPLVRTRAIQALSEQRDMRVLKVLEGGVKDEDPGVRLESTRCLAAYYLGDAQVGHNVKLSLPPTPDFPLFSPAVREPLVAALADTELRVRETAMNTLTAHNAPLLPTNLLFSVLKDRESDLRCRALGQLGRYSQLTPLDPVRACLKDPDPRVRAHAIQVLGRHRDPESFAAIASAASRGHEEARSATEVLGGFGEKAIPALAKALRHYDEQVREKASRALVEMKRPDADEALRAAAADHDGKTRRAATQGLQRLAPTSHTPEALADLVLKTQEGRTAGAMRSELVHMGAKAIPFLMPALKGSNTATRLAAAAILCEIGGPEVVPPLAGLMTENETALRICAIENLTGTRLTNEVSPVIRKALTDPEPEVREVAATALGQLQDKNSVRELAATIRDPNWHVRMAAAEALGRIRAEPGADALRLALADAQWPVRRAAAAGLGQMRDSKSVPTLTNMLSDAHWSVRQSAAASLKTITGQSFGLDIKAWQDWLNGTRTR